MHLCCWGHKYTKTYSKLSPLCVMPWCLINARPSRKRVLISNQVMWEYQSQDCNSIFVSSVWRKSLIFNMVSNGETHSLTLYICFHGVWFCLNCGYFICNFTVIKLLMRSPRLAMCAAIFKLSELCWFWRSELGLLVSPQHVLTRGPRMCYSYSSRSGILTNRDAPAMGGSFIILSCLMEEC